MDIVKYFKSSKLFASFLWIFAASFENDGHIGRYQVGLQQKIVVSICILPLQSILLLSLSEQYHQILSPYCSTIRVSKDAKVRNRYNQVPYLTQK